MDWYRITISAYAAVAFAAVSLVTDRFDRLIYSSTAREGLQFWRGSPPDYPLGQYAALIALPLAAVFFFVPVIIRRVGLPDKPFTRTVVGFAIFVAFVCVLLPNFGLHPGYILWGIAFATTLGFTEGLRAYNPDTDFVASPDVAKEAKVAKLALMSDKWLKALTLFATVCVAGLVTGALQLLTFNPTVMGKVGSGHANTAMGVMIFCLAPGISVGVVWQVFQKVNAIEEAYTGIRSDCPTKGTA